MNPKLMLTLFLAVSSVQLWVPIGQIMKYEDVLRTGHVYKFRTAPVDPYDAFRGKYVALTYANATAVIKPGKSPDLRNTAYVTLGRDGNGFAFFKELSMDPPPAGDYVRVEYFYFSRTSYMGGAQTWAQFRLPFDRFYMEEGKAPKAEQAYRQFGNPRNQAQAQAYALVRVKDGRGVIEDLYVNDQPIREFVKTRMP
jgi:uncharacterized membrane-anchored protein